MANLNKLLVHVPSDLCDGFKTKYVNGTDRSYDNKVVFLEKTQEIFTKGKLYGTSITHIKDFNDLKDRVGTIPSGAASNNIVDYISELISKADHIHSVSKKKGETLIDVNTSNKAVTINSTTALTTAVSNANSAIQKLELLGKHLTKNNNILTVEEAKSYLGLKSAAYQESSYFALPADVNEAKSYVIGKDIDDKTAYTIHGTRAYADYVASEAAQGVANILPGITEGNGIEVTSTPDKTTGKITYTISTSAKVFYYNGNKTTKEQLEQLPASDNKKGDVWSVGPADAAGSTLYAWDGDEWINIGGPNGVTDVDKKESHGVKLDKNSDGTVKVIVDPNSGKVESGNDKVITGGTAYTAIFEAKKACNSYVNTYVGKLSYSYTSKNGVYVNVKVDTAKGNVSYVGVTETNALKTAVTNANSAVQTINGDSPYLSANKKGTTVKLDFDETEVFNYVSNNIWETYSA